MPVRPALVALTLGLIGSACGAVVASPAVDDGATRPLAVGDPGAIPAPDSSMLAVDPNEIVFDTFDGGSIRFPDASAADRERLLDAIRPLDAPDYERADEVDWLTPDDVVVGYVDDDGDAWAYPTRILDRHEIVNDELAGRPLVVTWCPLCGSGVVFDRRLGDRTVSFSNTSALFENDMVMVDRETGSYWWQVAGLAILGTMVDRELELMASETTTFGRWLDRHPDSAVLARPGGRGYGPNPVSAYADVLDGGRTPFPVSDGVLEDARLPASTPVIVVELDGRRLAWATAPARTETIETGGIVYEVVLDGRGGRVVDPEGRAVPSRAAYWFSVVSVDPDVELVAGDG